MICLTVGVDGCAYMAVTRRLHDGYARDTVGLNDDCALVTLRQHDIAMGTWHFHGYTANTLAYYLQYWEPVSPVHVDGGVKYSAPELHGARDCNSREASFYAFTVTTVPPV